MSTSMSLRRLAQSLSPGASTPSAVQPQCRVQYPYFVPRNTRGNLPVYSEIRNGGSRYMISVRNVDGNANLLAQDLKKTLFEGSSPESRRMGIEIVRGKNLIITGGHWKNRIVEWLRVKGF